MSDPKKKQNPAKVSLSTMRKSQRKNKQEVAKKRTDVVMKATGRGDLVSGKKGNQMQPYRVNKKRK